MKWRGTFAVHNIGGSLMFQKKLDNFSIITYKAISLGPWKIILMIYVQFKFNL